MPLFVLNPYLISLRWPVLYRIDTFSQMWGSNKNPATEYYHKGP